MRISNTINVTISLEPYLDSMRGQMSEEVFIDKYCRGVIGNETEKLARFIVSQIQSQIDNMSEEELMDVNAEDIYTDLGKYSRYINIELGVYLNNNIFEDVNKFILGSNSEEYKVKIAGECYSPALSNFRMIRYDLKDMGIDTKVLKISVELTDAVTKTGKKVHPYQILTSAFINIFNTAKKSPELFLTKEDFIKLMNDRLILEIEPVVLSKGVVTSNNLGTIDSCDWFNSINILDKMFITAKSKYLEDPDVVSKCPKDSYKRNLFNTNIGIMSELYTFYLAIFKYVYSLKRIYKLSVDNKATYTSVLGSVSGDANKEIVNKAIAEHMKELYHKDELVLTTTIPLSKVLEIKYPTNLKGLLYDSLSDLTKINTPFYLQESDFLIGKITDLETSFKYKIQYAGATNSQVSGELETQFKSIIKLPIKVVNDNYDIDINVVNATATIISPIPPSGKVLSAREEIFIPKILQNALDSVCIFPLKDIFQFKYWLSNESGFNNSRVKKQIDMELLE